MNSSQYISCFVKGIHFLLTTENSPNIVITPPEEEISEASPAGRTVTIIKDLMLLHPFYHHTSQKLQVHRIRTDEEFDIEERYIYGSSNGNDLDCQSQDENNVAGQELSSADEEVGEEERYLYGYN